MNAQDLQQEVIKLESLLDRTPRGITYTQILYKLAIVRVQLNAEVQS